MLTPKFAKTLFLFSLIISWIYFYVTYTEEIDQALSTLSLEMPKLFMKSKSVVLKKCEDLIVAKGNIRDSIMEKSSEYILTSQAGVAHVFNKLLEFQSSKVLDIFKVITDFFIFDFNCKVVCDKLSALISRISDEIENGLFLNLKISSHIFKLANLDLGYILDTISDGIVIYHFYIVNIIQDSQNKVFALINLQN